MMCANVDQMCDMMLIRQIITLCIAPPELIQQDQDRAATQCKSYSAVTKVTPTWATGGVYVIIVGDCQIRWIVSC